MTPEEDAYVRYRLQRSRSALKEAKLLLDAGLLPAAVNRIYYAGFYCVCALLLTEGQRRAKHSGIRALFDKEGSSDFCDPRVSEGRRVPERAAPGRLLGTLFAPPAVIEVEGGKCVHERPSTFRPRPAGEAASVLPPSISLLQPR